MKKFYKLNQFREMLKPLATLVLFFAFIMNVNAAYIGGTTTTIKLYKGNASDAGALTTSTQQVIGTSAWKNDQTVSKMELYLPLTALGTFTINDIASLKFSTEKVLGSPTNEDIYWSIYTNNYTGGMLTWYGQRLTSEPLYCNNFNAPYNIWSTYTTNAGTNQMTFYDGNHGPLGIYNAPTLNTLQSGSINWANYGGSTTSIDYGIQTVKAISLGTGSAWNAIMMSYIDDIEITLNNGNKLIIDLEENPSNVYVDANYTSTSCGGHVCNGDAFASVQNGINAVAANGTVNIAAGTYNFTSQMNIVKSGISVIGQGNVIFKANNATWSTTNGSNHLIDIYAGTGSNPVTISNITMNSNSQNSGINTYGNAYCVLNDVTINGSKGAGLTVNGSTVVATNLTTATNAWGAVNVDPGSGVTTPSVFTLNSGTLAENNQIWSDGAHVTGSATVTVNATGYNKYNSGTNKIWTNRALTNCATITKNGETTIYSTIPAAVNAATQGDEIDVFAGTYEFTSQLNIDKPGISIIGQGNVIFKANNATWNTANNDSKHLIGIYAGTSSNPVIISNITMNFNSQCYGLNTYGNAYCLLNGATLNGSKGAGLIVNGSTVTATNLTTATNAWGAVNVDPGLGVTTPSVFTLNSGTLAENNQIWSDGAHVTVSATVTVNATGYNKYNSGTNKIWTNRPLTNCATITTSGETSIYSTIQAAIDAAVTGDVINVYPGNYYETASNRPVFGVASYQFGLFIDKNNLTIRGVKADGSVITNVNDIVAKITTNSTANFGPSGIFVQANNVTLQGLEIGDNIVNSVVTSNKTIEVVGDAFTMNKCYVNTSSDEGVIYLGRWDASHPIISYSITDNKITNSVVSINNGVGITGLNSGRLITGNTFSGVATPYLIGFRGWNGASPAQGWIVDPVGGAVITGNTFNNTGVVNYVIARGNTGGYDNSQLNWNDIWTSNTYGNKVVALANQSTFDVRSYADAGGYTETRRISPVIQDNITVAQVGDKILVGAGTYTENVTIGKALTLNGANTGIVCGSRTTESVISPSTGIPFTVNADGVTINGFEITAPNSTNAITCVNTGRSNLSILFNNIHNIGTALTTGNVHSIQYTVPNGANTNNVTISDNCFNNISSALLSNNSSSAIGILQSVSDGVLTGLNIERNTINQVNVNTANWPAGKIAYGIQINVGGGANYLTATGKVINANIKNNAISNIKGFIATGIALEGNTENAVVKYNTVSYLTSYKSDNRANGGYDLNGLKFENNRYVGTVTVEDNSFQTASYMHNTTSNSGYAVANYVPSSVGTANVTCNWFGTANAYEIADNASLTGKILNKAGCNTNFLPYLSTNDIVTPVCSGVGPVTNITHTASYMTIQAAIDAATTGDEIHVAAGTYTEQLYITKNITVNGAGKATTFVKSPATLTHFYNSGSNNYPVIDIDGASSCTIKNITVDGDKKGNANYRFQGIGFWNAGGTVQDVDVINIIDNPFSGAQHGVGIYAFNNIPTTSYSITLTNINVTEFQKTAVALIGSDDLNNLTVSINNVTTTGKGATNVTAQNGIEVWGASGTINNCNISNIAWTGGTWTATGLLIGGPGSVVADHVNIDNCQTSVYWLDAEGTYKNSTITNPLGDGVYGYSSTGTHNFTVNNVTMTGTDVAGSWGINSLADGGTLNMNITNCNITHCNYGIYAYDYGTSGGVLNTIANHNKITLNTYGFATNASTTQDATNNYWGSTTPDFNTILDGNISYCPYYTDALMTNSYCPPVINITQDKKYYTIQAAVTAANANDEINVAAGIYTEVGQIVIDKNLTIVGADKTTTIIKPAQSTPLTGWNDADAWFLVQSGKTFNLSNVTLDGDGQLTSIGLFSHGTGTIDNNIIKNITYQVSGQPYNGKALASFGGNMTFSNNTLSNIGRIGIYFGTGVTNGIATGNTYTGKGVGDWLDYGIEIERGAIATCTNNTITECKGLASDGSTSSAMLLTTYFAPGTTGTFTNNSIFNNTYGITAGYDGTDQSIVDIHNNKIYNNSVFGVKSTNATVDAINNYWGTCPSVNGNVNYFPYYTTVTGSPFVFGGTINNIVSSASPAAVCLGASSSINATGGSSYVWAGLGAGASKVVSPIVNTTYNVTANDAQGCPGAFASVEVTVNAVPTVSINQSAGSGTSKILTASGASTYLWNTGAIINPITVNPTATTTYTVTGTNSFGCTGTATSTVTVITASAGANQYICSGLTAQLNATVVGGSATTYLWSPSSTLSNAAIQNPIASPLATTTYTVTINGTYTSSVTVYVYPKPVANAGTAVTISTGGSGTLNASVSGGTAPYVYAWTGPSSFASAVSNPTVNTGGTYNLTVRDAFNCQSANSSTIVSVAATGYTVSGNVSYYNTTNNQMHNVTVKLKQGATTMYTAVTNATGNGDYSILGVANGTYTVYFSLTTPWGGVTTTDIAAIAKHYASPGAIPLSGIKRLAADVTLGTYSNTDAFVNVNDMTLVNTKRVTPTTVFPTGDWVFTKESDVLANATPFTFANSGGFSNITITVNNGAVTQSFKSLCYGDVDASYTGLKTEEQVVNMTSGNGLQLSNYPNPFTNSTTISYNTPVDGTATVDVFDLLGNKVASIADPNKKEGSHLLNFNAGSLSQGIYIYTLTVKTSDDVLIQTGKMIISK